jgi:protein-tyrosine-phosphatase
MAAALLEKHLRAVTTRVSVSSGGLKYTGEPMPPVGLSAMAEHGVDLSSYLSAQVAEDTVAAADIILGMAREHVREVVAISPDAWPKTFTLKDFVRRAEGHTRGRHQRVTDWLDGIGAERGPYDVLGADPEDDVHDPFRQRSRVWNRVIAEVDELVSRFVPTLGMSRPEPSGSHENVLPLRTPRRPRRNFGRIQVAR